MSMEILEQNWKIIVEKVVKPLWNTEYASMYKSKRLDYDDFESLAGYELTKAFINFDSQKSNVLTFATNVLKRKPKTELRNEGRQKRAAISTAVSIHDKVGEDTEKTYEDMMENKDFSDDNTQELNDMVAEMCSVLRPRDAKILNYACLGCNNEQIAENLHVPLRVVTDIRKKISESSAIKRIARKYGFFGGCENEI